MNRETFASRLQEEMSCVRVSPQLRSRTLHAMQRKEGKPMKKKCSAALAFVLMLTLFAAAALAVAYHTGILDFAGRYDNVYIPADAQSYVGADVLQVENEMVSVNVSELYYDGRLSRMTVEVQPKDPAALLLGPISYPEDPWLDMVWQSQQQDEGDTRTIADVYRESGYQAAYCVDTWLHPLSGEAVGGSGDQHLNPDGTLTLYCETEYSDDLPMREAVFQLYLTPWETPLAEDCSLLSEQMAVLEAPLTLEADASLNETYTSTQAVDYPEAGVRVDQLTIEVRPQEIHATIDYTVTDRTIFDAGEQGVWFEFIDPASTQEEPYAQRLHGGLSGGGSSAPMDDANTRYRQTETLGRNELHDTYTLRAFNSWSKERYETHTFEMKKVEK